jgi:hypothetical protein
MKERMKNSMLNMAWLFIAAMVAFSACSKDEDEDPPIFIEDGVYVIGVATGFDNPVLGAMMMDGREEGDGFSSNLRTGMYEKYMYLNAGNFTIFEKRGLTESFYGWKAGTEETFDNLGEGDETNGPVYSGEFQANGTTFNAPTSGFYHIIMDETKGMVWFTKINHWAVIGDATDLGWSGEIPMTQVSLTAEAAEWEVTEVTIRERGGFKFRYNDGWKISTEGLIIFANIGKGEADTEFITGGGTFAYPTEGEGAYTISLTWTLEDGFAYSTTRTGDVEPLPEYPTELYMIGNGLNMDDSDSDGTPDGWQWALTDFQMIPTAGNKEHLFWKIVWLLEGGEFKFSPVRDWNGDFGKDGDATDGIYAKGSQNIPVPGSSGYYMVVVNLETEQIAVVDPKVYLIGDAIGSWTTADPEGLFTVDNTNEVITITKALAATPELRMYAWFDAAEGWFTDWWQHEFMILSGKIEFRGSGGDQERVAVSAATYKIDLNFRTGNGTIEQP